MSGSPLLKLVLVNEAKKTNAIEVDVSRGPVMTRSQRNKFNLTINTAPCQSIQNTENLAEEIYTKEQMDTMFETGKECVGISGDAVVEEANRSIVEQIPQQVEEVSIKEVEAPSIVESIPQQVEEEATQLFFEDDLPVPPLVEVEAVEESQSTIEEETALPFIEEDDAQRPEEEVVVEEEEEEIVFVQDVPPPRDEVIEEDAISPRSSSTNDEPRGNVFHAVIEYEEDVKRPNKALKVKHWLTLYAQILGDIRADRGERDDEIITQINVLYKEHIIPLHEIRKIKTPKRVLDSIDLAFRKMDAIIKDHVNYTTRDAVTLFTAAFDLAAWRINRSVHENSDDIIDYELHCLETVVGKRAADKIAREREARMNEIQGAKIEKEIARQMEEARKKVEEEVKRKFAANDAKKAEKRKRENEPSASKKSYICLDDYPTYNKE